MIRQHRTIHRWAWLLLAPLLLAIILLFSQPAANLSPANALIPAISGDSPSAPTGKGVLP